METIKKTYITQEGLEKLKKELEYLKTTRRKEVSQHIQVAKEQGDLTENAEYADAKEEQAFLEGRILELETTLKNAVIIKNGDKALNTTEVGCTILLKSDGEQIKYTIVGSNEADPTAGKISNESPIGKALLGHKVGDKIEVEAPDKKIEYEIIGIE